MLDPEVVATLFLLIEQWYCIPDGSPHSSEVQLIAWPLDVEPRPDAVGLELGATMQSYWANFIRTGNPNDPGLESWPAFGATDALVMQLGDRIAAVEIPDRARLELIERYFRYRRADAGD